MNRLARRMILTLSALGMATPAFAWGPQGHRVIAKVATDRLSPAARSGVRDLLHPGDTLADIAGWADREGYDKYPGSGPWHYVNVPITADRLDHERDCRGGRNVVDKVVYYRKTLASKGSSKEERQVALLFLVHFVSDVHQPLHVGNNGDHGGNDTQIQFFGVGTNLHRMWDSDMIHKIGGDDRAWVARVERRITPEAARAWSEGKVEDWADESLRVAKVGYRIPDGSKSTIQTGATLGDAYMKVAEPLMEEQMARAGVRLANELNAIFH